MPTLQTYNGYPLWHYIPNLPAAIAFEALFGVVTVLHIYLLVRKRMWFCLPFVIGGIFEVVGYQGRALAYNKTGELIPYILQSIFSLLAPILFAATLYMTLGRTIRAVHGEQYSIISPRWLTRIFVLGDIFSFLIQASGAGILVKNGTGNDNNDTQLGNYIIVGGLIFQIIIFGVFLLAVFMFNVRFAKHKGKNQRRHSEATRGASWQGMLHMLYVTSSCILIRNIFRTVQYIMGQGGYLLAHEWAVYVFDGALMLLTMVCFLIRYPSHLDRMEDEDYGTELGGRDEGSRV